MAHCVDSVNGRAKSFNVLIAATGSVASIKIPNLVKGIRAIEDFSITIKLIVTEHATHFFKSNDIEPAVEVYTDSAEWSTWSKRGDPVLHIELGKWADVLLIAPLDANTLGKVANGLCDNLVTCTVRAWDFAKPVLFCPAMNTRMWEHPVTAPHVQRLKDWGFTEVAVVNKRLECGDVGAGGMAEVDTILQQLRDTLASIKNHK